MIKSGQPLSGSAICHDHLQLGHPISRCIDPTPCIYHLGRPVRLLSLCSIEIQSPSVAQLGAVRCVPIVWSAGRQTTIPRQSGPVRVLRQLYCTGQYCTVPSASFVGLDQPAHSAACSYSMYRTQYCTVRTLPSPSDRKTPTNQHSLALGIMP